MTPEALKELLGDSDLHQTLDVKTLVVDTIRKKDAMELEALFWQNLDSINEEQIRDYFYMSRS